MTIKDTDCNNSQMENIKNVYENTINNGQLLSFGFNYCAFDGKINTTIVNEKITPYVLSDIKSKLNVCFDYPDLECSITFIHSTRGNISYNETT